MKTALSQRCRHLPIAPNSGVGLEKEVNISVGTCVTVSIDAIAAARPSGISSMGRNRVFWGEAGTRRDSAILQRVLLLIGALFLGQGLPNTIQPPRADERMILERPSAFSTEWRKIMAVPREKRRAALDRLPPDRRSLLLRGHLDRVFNRYKGKLPYAELVALTECSNAAVPAAFTDDVKAREKYQKAEEHLLRTLSRPALDEVQELLPTSEPATARPFARSDSETSN